MIDHFLYILRRKLGKTIVKATPLEFVVTVPAIWTESANQRTKRACERALERAQIAGPVHLVSEPEAAAIFALHGLDTHGLKVGDTMVVVDAGGGTVDLISYTVTALKPILEVKEAAPGSGALCGSVFVNAGFHEFFKSKLGKAEGFDDEVLADAMESFERIFKPVVDQVIELVKVQIKQSNVPIKALLLVGGFGASAYLRERIRDAIDNSIEILQPSHAWQAIVQGAVMKGLAMVSVRGRVARKHFGIDLQVPGDL
ncbi:Heat shock 70 kDa protein 12A [Escovopsis weberi]|uniref:Heat shock 70 kDa protein 12A n=1 Tax=Escovopsis weberi TaxID=150374 RepID=A0A0M9VWZ0_ESCWE|nr:Heat shock 70 kDa protein 12A [Escovopsis weberi]